MLFRSQGIDVENLTDGMYDVLVKALPIADIVQVREIDIAPAGIELAGAELALSSMIGRERALQRALEPARKQYDNFSLTAPAAKRASVVAARPIAPGKSPLIPADHTGPGGAIAPLPSACPSRSNFFAPSPLRSSGFSLLRAFPGPSGRYPAYSAVG